MASRVEPFTLAHGESVSSTTFGWNSLTRSNSCDDGNPVVRSDYKGGCVLDVGGIEGASLTTCPGW